MMWLHPYHRCRDNRVLQVHALYVTVEAVLNGCGQSLLSVLSGGVAATTRIVLWLPGAAPGATKEHWHEGVGGAYNKRWDWQTC